MAKIAVIELEKTFPVEEDVGFFQKRKETLVVNLPPNVMREECCVGYNRTRKKSPALLSQIATVLNADFYDMRSLSWSDISRFLRLRKPEYLVCSISYSFKEWECEIFRICESLGIKCIVVPVPFHYAEQLAREFNCYFVVYSEPEKTLRDWVHGTPVEKLKGIIYEKDGKTVRNPSQRPSFKMVPPIDFEKFDLGKYNSFVYQIGRGCPYQCKFCSWAGQPYQLKPVSTVLRDLKEMEKMGIKKVYLLSSQITTNKKWLREFCNEKIRQEIKILWTTDIRANELTLDSALLMRRAGCIRVFMGVESVCDDLLEKINKGLTRKQIIDALKICREAGLLVNIPFMFNIGEDIRHFKKYISFVKHFLVPTVGVTTLKIHPHTTFGDEGFEALESQLAEVFKNKIRIQSGLRIAARLWWLLSNGNARRNWLDVLRTWDIEVLEYFVRSVFLGDFF